MSQPTWKYTFCGNAPVYDIEVHYPDGGVTYAGSIVGMGASWRQVDMSKSESFEAIGDRLSTQANRYAPQDRHRPRPDPARERAERRLQVRAMLFIAEEARDAYQQQWSADHYKTAYEGWMRFLRCAMTPQDLPSHPQQLFKELTRRADMLLRQDEFVCKHEAVVLPVQAPPTPAGQFGIDGAAVMNVLRTVGCDVAALRKVPCLSSPSSHLEPLSGSSASSELLPTASEIEPCRISLPVPIQPFVHCVSALDSPSLGPSPTSVVSSLLDSHYKLSNSQTQPSSAPEDTLLDEISSSGFTNDDNL